MPTSQDAKHVNVIDLPFPHSLSRVITENHAARGGGNFPNPLLCQSDRKPEGSYFARRRVVTHATYHNDRSMSLSS